MKREGQCRCVLTSWEKSHVWKWIRSGRDCKDKNYLVCGVIIFPWERNLLSGKWEVLVEKGSWNSYKICRLFRKRWKVLNEQNCLVKERWNRRHWKHGSFASIDEEKICPDTKMVQRPVNTSYFYLLAFAVLIAVPRSPG